MTRAPRLLSGALLVLLAACSGRAPVPEAPPLPAEVVDDVAVARSLLEAERERLREGRGMAPADRIRRMAELGMWEEAEALLAGSRGDAEVRLAEAELRLRQHRYREAEGLVEAVLAARPAHRAARLARARLHVQAWRLGEAAALATDLLRRNPRDEGAALLLGRIRLLEKDYDEALRLALEVQGWNPRSADAYLLEADARFWDQDPAGAEAPLARALALDPFDPDARFGYGYAIWRRVDA